MQAHRAPSQARQWELYVAYGLAGLCFLAAAFLRFWHLDADIEPSVSPSLAFLTDEGWKSANALSKYIRGEWLNTQRNHILLLPVVPVLQLGLFELFGLSLTTLRAPSVVFSLLGMLVSGLWIVRGRAGDRRAVWTLLVFAALIATHHQYYVFSRMALVDIPMFAVGLLALYVFHGEGWRAKPWASAAILAGSVLAVAVLTKTSGVLFFGVLAIALVIDALASQRLPIGELKRAAITVGVSIAVVGVVHVATNLLLVHGFDKAPTDNVARRILDGGDLERHYWLFWTRRVFQKAPLLFWASLIGVLGTILTASRERAMPSAERVMLAVYLSIWLFYGFFQYQPERYLVVVALPMTYFAARLPAYVAPALARPKLAQVLLVIAAVGTLGIAQRWHVGQLTHYLKTPKHSLRNSARKIQARVRRDAAEQGIRNPVLYGEFSSTFAAVTGMPFSFDIYTKARPIYVAELAEEADHGAGVTFLGRYRVVRQHKHRDVFLYRWNAAKRPPPMPKRLPR